LSIGALGVVLMAINLVKPKLRYAMKQRDRQGQPGVHRQPSLFRAGSLFSPDNGDRDMPN
jgi:hypothetical protein